MREWREKRETDRPNLERVTAIQKTPKEIDRRDLDIEGGLLSSAALRFSRLPQEHSFATAALNLSAAGELSRSSEIVREAQSSKYIGKRYG